MDGNIAFIQEYQEKYLKDSPLLPEGLEKDYRIYACLKETEEKQIYILKHKLTGKSFILKCTLNAGQETADNEYQLLRSLESTGCPGLPRALGLYRSDKKSFLLEDYVPGVSLFDHIDAGRNFTVSEILSIGMQICKILVTMHGQNPPVIHRDISPKNILLSKDGSVTLIDLGIARKYAIDKSDDTVYIGTAVSAPPEQFGYGQTDTRSDIYSVGVLLYYLAAKNYNLKSLSETGLPHSLRKIVKKCTEFDPKKRYQKVDILYRHLKSLCSKPKYIKASAIMLKKYRRLQAVCCLLVLLLTVSISAYFYQYKVNSYYTAPVTFQSPLIETAVRQELSLSPEEPINREMLKLVTSLYICGDQIYASDTQYDFRAHSYINEQEITTRGPIISLADLSAMTHLSELSLPNQKISDLSPIKDLPLKKLNLGSNEITDISLLSGFTDLKELYIGDNPVSDLSVLADLMYLDYLNIDALTIPDLTFLNSLDLDTFSFMITVVKNRDYSPLESQTSLKALDTMDMDVAALPYVNQLKTLKILKLYSCKFTSLHELNNLSGLNELHMHSSGLASLDGIGTFPELTYLGIENVKVTDITPITALKKLTGLGIIDTPVKDYSPLKELPVLNFINCTEEQRALIYGN